MNFDSNMPWVTFYLLNELYAISANNVIEMLAMPKVRSVPGIPDYMRGVISLRGKNFSVLDLRKFMGMTSLIDETNDLIQLLKDREQDHKNWISELEASVKEKREFKLTTDPNLCAFGKWYNNFKTDNRILSNILKRFNQPHKKIHSIAIDVKNYVNNDEFDLAFKIIEDTRNKELAEMILLFSEVRNTLLESNREIALVLESDNNSMVVSVDSVASVENIVESDIEKVSKNVSTTENEFLAGVGKSEKDKRLIHLLDVKKLIQNESNLLL